MDIEKYKTLFLSEAREYLRNMNSSVLSLEKDPQNRDLLDALFRHVHSLKGMSASMGYNEIQELSHRLESYMDSFRQEKKVLDEKAIDLLLRGVDSLSVLVDAVYSPLRKETDTSAHTKVPSRGDTATLRVRASFLDELVDSVGELLVAQSRLESMLRPPSLPLQFSSGALAESGQPVSSGPDHSVQPQREEGSMEEAIDALNRQIHLFHSKILSLRLAPLSTIADKYSRAIRDLVRQKGKQVDFSIEGGGVELDRRILEELEAPILHLLRNSVDHGIEPPEERIAAKKEKTGKVALRARRERDHVIIEVSDDGAGMDPEDLKAKAMSLGALSPEKASVLSREDALLLACLPGVSTARVVSESSGRGVGMDVVKSKIEALGGHLTLISSPGQGTCVSMTIPVSVSLVPVLLVTIPSHVFGLPLSRVEIILKEKETESYTCNGDRHILYDGEKVPLKDLSALLGTSADTISPPQGSHIVVCDVRGKRKALRVGQHLSHLTAYLRPLKPPLNKIPGLFGTTLLGDGRLIFILDPQGLFP